MKLLYTNHGILTEAKVRFLLRNGVDVQIAGQSGLVEGVIEGGPSTRRAARDAAIDASISDFEDEPEPISHFEDDRELSPTSYPGPMDDLDPVHDFNSLSDEIPPGSTPMDTEEGWDFDFSGPWYEEPLIDEGRDLDDPDFFGDEPSEPEVGPTGEAEDIPLLDIEKAGFGIPSAGIPDEEDDFTGYTFSDEEWFTKGKPEQASEEDEDDLGSNEDSWFVEGRSLKENLKTLVRECMDEFQNEELQHSQTGFADMQPAVVAESSVRKRRRKA